MPGNHLTTLEKRKKELVGLAKDDSLEETVTSSSCPALANVPTNLCLFKKD